jgi:hypothetical protein
MRRVVTVVATIAAALFFAACGGTDTETVTQTTTVTEPAGSGKAKSRPNSRRHGIKRAEPASTPKPRHRRSASPGSFTMPDETGQDLQAAQDDIQRVSHDPLFVSHSQDATGDDRFQILDRDWQVCGQNVPPGTTASAVEHIVFFVVKDYEDCP